MKRRKWLLPSLIAGGAVILCFVCILVSGGFARAEEGNSSYPSPQTPYGTLVQHKNADASISLEIPDGWEYAIEDSHERNNFCIAFWPAGQAEGKLKVWYYDAFGVCGTGLTQEKITLGKYEARQGTYDNKKVWDFISFIDTQGDYVIMNEGAEAWWDSQGDTAMQILSTLTLGGENADGK